jgi:hypothetical protein
LIGRTIRNKKPKSGCGESNRRYCGKYSRDAVNNQTKMGSLEADQNETPVVVVAETTKETEEESEQEPSGKPPGRQ